MGEKSAGCWPKPCECAMRLRCREAYGQCVLRCPCHGLATAVHPSISNRSECRQLQLPAPILPPSGWTDTPHDGDGAHTLRPVPRNPVTVACKTKRWSNFTPQHAVLGVEVLARITTTAAPFAIEEGGFRSTASRDALRAWSRLRRGRSAWPRPASAAAAKRRVRNAYHRAT